MPFPASRSALCKPPPPPSRDALNAGASPNSTPVSTDSAIANVSTLASTAISPVLGSVSGSTPTSSVVPARAIAAPSSPPINASRTLSVSN